MATAYLYFTDIRHPAGSAGVISQFLAGTQRHAALVLELDDGSVRVFRAGPLPVGGTPDRLFAEVRSYASLALALEFDADVHGALGVQQVGTLSEGEGIAMAAALGALRDDINSRAVEYSPFSANSNMAAYMGCLTGGLTCDALPLDTVTGNQIDAFGWGGLLPTFDAAQFAAHQPVLNQDGSYSVSIGSDVFTYNLPEGWNRVDHADGTRYEARSHPGSVTTALDVRTFDADGVLQYSADYFKSFVGTQDVIFNETYFEGAEARATVHTTFSGNGADFTQTVSRDGTDVQFGLNEEGETVVTAVTAVNGVTLSSADSARFAQALRNAGVRPENLIDRGVPDGLPDIELDFDTQAGEWEFTASFDEGALSLEYLVGPEGVAHIDRAFFGTDQVPEAFEPLFDFFLAPELYPVLGADSLQVEVLGDEILVDVATAQGYVLELRFFDGAVGVEFDADIPGQGQLSTDTTYYSSGAVDSESFSSSFGYVRSALNSTQTRGYTFGELLDGSTVESLAIIEGSGFRMYSRSVAADGTPTHTQIFYPDGSDFEAYDESFLRRTMLTFNDAADPADSTTMTFGGGINGQGSDASARAFGTEVAYSFFSDDEFTVVAGTDFQDRQSRISYSAEAIHRNLDAPVEGYAHYFDIRVPGELRPRQLGVVTDDDWAWFEASSDGLGWSYEQRNPEGQIWAWSHDASGHGIFSYGSVHGFTVSDGVNFGFYIVELDAEGNAHEVPVPFGYTGTLPSFGFDLARRPQPIENLHPVVDYDFTTVAVRDSVAFAPLVHAFDLDGDAIVSYELTQTNRRTNGGFLTIGDAPPLPEEAVYTVSPAELGQVLLHGGGARGMELYWVRAYDGELWSPWASIGVRTASDEGPEITAIRSVIGLDEVVDISAFFSATDPEGEDIKLYEFQDVVADGSFLEFFDHDIRAGKIHTVFAEDLGGLKLHGADAHDVIDLIAVRAFAGEIWGDWTTISVTTEGNRAPIHRAAIDDQTAQEDAIFTFQVPLATFEDQDPGDELTYTATLADGSALPAWLSFAPQQRQFVGAPAQSNVGSIDVRVTATDGGGLSASDTFRLWVANVNDVATVSASNRTLTFGSSVAAASLFSVADEDGDAPAQYEFWDSSAGNGHFSVNGVEAGVNVAIPVAAAHLANTTFTASAANGSDQVWVRVNDGQAWSAWKSWTVFSSPHETNALPVVSASNAELLINTSVEAAGLFAVADADGDAITRYEFWDDAAGGGYFALDGMAQGTNPIAIDAGQLADLDYVAGAAPGTEQVWVRASDGIGWSAWRAWNMTSALHVPNAAPTITAQASQIVLLAQPLAAASLFSAADADGDPLMRYEFWDSTAGNGHWALNGVEQGVNAAIAVADLDHMAFVGAEATGSDLVWVRASDGQAWGEWKSWTMNSWPHAQNAAPMVSASSAQLLTNGAAAAASLFSVTDADGDAMTRYEFWDDVNGGGYWRVNGVQQGAAQTIPVSAADLAATEYVAGASGGTEQVWVRAHDGLEWSAWRAWNMTSALHIPNAAPVVGAAAAQTVLLGSASDASTLFSASDADGDAVVRYELWDSTAGNGYWSVSGIAQAVNSAIAVTNLEDAQFIGASAAGSDLVWARAHDGQSWSDWRSWTMQSSPHLTNAAPVAGASHGGLLRGEAVQAAGLFSVSDADADAATQYQFWDDVNGGGYWRLNGVQQAAGRNIDVAAAELGSLEYVGGANAGTEQVWVRASDGIAWGAWRSWLMSTEGGMLRGGPGPDTLAGEAGPTVLEGGGDDDTLTDADGNNLFSGGDGDDQMTGGAGSDFFAGGAGDDTVHTGDGANLVAYNAGDGLDWVYSDAGAANTLSFGGGIAYQDLSLSKDGDDLIVSTGGGEGVVLKDWYAGKDTVADLQVVLGAGYDPEATDELQNRRVQNFDFRGMVSAFDQARAETPGLTSWALTNALLAFHLSGSDDEAQGGDLAYWYARNGSLNGISLQAAQQLIGAAGFGSDAQSLQPFTGLQDGFVKLA
jgi:hypothetical protein